MYRTTRFIVGGGSTADLKWTTKRLRDMSQACVADLTVDNQILKEAARGNF